MKAHEPELMGCGFRWTVRYGRVVHVCDLTGNHADNHHKCSCRVQCYEVGRKPLTFEERLMQIGLKRESK